MAAGSTTGGCRAAGCEKVNSRSSHTTALGINESTDGSDGDAPDGHDLNGLERRVSRRATFTYQVEQKDVGDSFSGGLRMVEAAEPNHHATFMQSAAQPLIQCEGG